MSTPAARRERLVARLPELEVEAFLVTRLPNVRYLTGFTGSNGQLLLAADRATFLTDGRYGEQARREVQDLERGVYTGEFPPFFGRACRDLDVRRVAFESLGVTHKTFVDLSGTDVALVPTTGEVERLRWIKAPEEIRLLERAQALADDAFELIAGKLSEGMSERDVALEIELAMRRGGAEGPAFDTIVAFGEGAAEPHHRAGDRVLARGDVVKLDFGCVVDGYHCDMTRTVAFGQPDPRIREAHRVVAEAQRAGMAAVHAGTTGGEADRAAREVIERAGYGDRYTHSLGHGVGLEIHEGPTLRANGADVVPAGAVVTVEPGIYLEGVGGVRIEDMVEVGANGCRILPRSSRELLVL